MVLQLMEIYLVVYLVVCCELFKTSVEKNVNFNPSHLHSYFFNLQVSKACARYTCFLFGVYCAQLKKFVERKAEKPIHIVITCDVPTYGNFITCLLGCVPCAVCLQT